MNSMRSDCTDQARPYHTLEAVGEIGEFVGLCGTGHVTARTQVSKGA